jgi:acyl CoA:acetate/3-ketoacid CoA transferase beta subunit
MCRETFVMLRHEPRAFVEELDFLTTPGKGVTCVVTDLGVLEPADAGELTLTELHPGVTVDQALEATGWDLRAIEDPRRGKPPTRDELAALRALKPANGDTVAR